MRGGGKPVTTGNADANRGELGHQSGRVVTGETREPWTPSACDYDPHRGGDENQHSPGISGIGKRRDAAHSSSQLGQYRADGQMHELQPDRRGTDAQPAAFVVFPAGGAPDLAAGSLEHGMRRGQHDIVGRHAQNVQGGGVDLTDQSLRVPARRSAWFRRAPPPARYRSRRRCCRRRRRILCVCRGWRRPPAPDRRGRCCARRG